MEQSPSWRLPVSDRHDEHVVKWSDTARDCPGDKCVHELFEDRVKRMPDAVAVIFQDKQFTYNELNLRANRLAYFLKSKGVGPDFLVGICVERSLEMVIGILGILKAGGAYVPLDTSYPSDRLEFMMKDSHVKLLLTQNHLRDKLPIHKACVICMESFRDSNGPADLINPDTEMAPAHKIDNSLTSKVNHHIRRCAHMCSGEKVVYLWKRLYYLILWPVNIVSNRLAGII